MKRVALLILTSTMIVGAACSGGGGGKAAQSGKVASTTTATAAPTTTTTEAPTTTTTAAPTTTTTAPPPSPEETIRALVAAEASGDWNTAWGFAHSDALKYTNKAAFIKDQQAAAARGYQYVSVDVSKVTIVKWVFSKCAVAAFGPKTYDGAAAIEVTYHASAPSGGALATPAITHFVKAADGHWKFFPSTGCEHVAGQ